jgi:hypothetical protein
VKEIEIEIPKNKVFKSQVLKSYLTLNIILCGKKRQRNKEREKEKEGKEERK